MLAAGLAFAPPIAEAQQGSGIVRDAETEALLQDYVRPLFKAAGIRSPSIQIFLIPSDGFNAFVANGRQMFVNTGTIIDSETPGEMIGVLAHETGHLARDDLAHLRQAIEDTKTAMIIASLLGMGAAVAGTIAGSPNAAATGSGIMTGAFSVGEHSLLAYKRTQESAADRVAVDYLNATGQSGAGLLATMKRLADENLFASRRADPYLQSHPLPRERVIALEGLVKESRYFGRTDAPAMQLRHEMVRAKLVGFTWPAGRVLTRYPAGDSSLPARYARAISTYRFGQLAPAVKQIDGLIAENPGFPYFWELKGQALLETGNPKAAIEPLRKAVSLAPQSGLLKIMLGQALVATDNKGLAGEAVKVLTVGLQADPDASIGFRALARAYAMQDNIAMAQLATAQGLLADGNVKEAKTQAARAQAKLKTGSPAWLRADDIVSYNPPKLN
ncbi:MAG: M48 family metalloprotease [Bauldia sp.]